MMILHFLFLKTQSWNASFIQIGHYRLLILFVVDFEDGTKEPILNDKVGCMK
ncbi:hypothetical protein D0Y65_030012 [Glycine soja]|uniref:Uncharacterized protein n=1 Tax=Glycine soja TaxID=3848 RepID=A0A445I1Z7_GLYSO|nr:hypothetical protein D0Y65_030012 [Glycine soja]